MNSRAAQSIGQVILNSKDNIKIAILPKTMSIRAQSPAVQIRNEKTVILTLVGLLRTSSTSALRLVSS